MPSPADQSFAQALSALQAGQIEDAERQFQKILRLHPRHVPALNLYSIVLTQLSRFAEAEQFIARAIQENASSDASFYNYGIILKALNRYPEALKQFDRALAINSAVPETINARGECYLELDRAEDALADFDKALAANPKSVEALINKARALNDLEQYDAGLTAIDRAIALAPAHPLAWLARGRVLHGLKRHVDALEAFDRALTLQPELAEALLGRATSYRNLKRHDDALATFEKVLSIAPEDADAWHGYGDSLVELRELDKAMSAYKKVVALRPDHAGAYSSMGVLLNEQGKVSDANRAFRCAIELDPRDGAFHWNLGFTKKFTAADPDITAMEKLVQNSTELSKQDRVFLDFALGKAYADAGDRRRSFQHYLSANAGERAGIAYDETRTLANFDAIENVFTPELIAAKANAGDLSARPIFIVGMPRSGSTLVEQILASHSAVEGVGEVDAFVHATINELQKADDTRLRDAPYPDFVPALGAQAIKSIGENYLRRLATLAPSGMARIADKMLSNFLNCGLIHLALPNAVILHTTRDPVDTCISCFTMKFRDELQHVYDLAELGRYYMRYQGLMAHWHRVLPPARILDVQYEDVVADVEGQARRIIAHCGLPWDDRCLDFHKNERTVRTASVVQVRQPIYKSSVSRWRAYEEFLGPLLKELGIDATQAN